MKYQNVIYYSLWGKVAFHDRPFLSYGSYCFFDEKHKYKKVLKFFSSKNKRFHNLQKVSKNTVLNTMAIDQW